MWPSADHTFGARGVHVVIGDIPFCPRGLHLALVVDEKCLVRVGEDIVHMVLVRTRLKHASICTVEVPATWKLCVRACIIRHVRAHGRSGLTFTFADIF